MQDRFYTNWPLDHRPSQRLPSRFDPDDLLRRDPKELLEMIVRRLQELWDPRTSTGVRQSSLTRLIEDFTLLALAVLRLVDARDRNRTS